MMKRRGVGEPCTYCERPMEDRASMTGLAATRDHYHPKSKGGREIVLACRTCNSIKGDMLPADWQSFMKCFPRWWEHPQFKDIGHITRLRPFAQPTYMTAWDKDGKPIARYQRKPKKVRTATKSETEAAFKAWQAKSMRQRQHDAKGLPYEESMMILRHGKDYWRAWKDRGGEMCDCCAMEKPKAVPAEYDDPRVQASFEGVYKGREHLLRVQRC